jgi:ABC-2 type transport system permease protein
MSDTVQNVIVIFKRELKSYFESPVAYVFLVVFLLLVMFLTFSVSHFYEYDSADLRSSFFFWHPWIYLLLVPAASMRLWAEERRSGTIELLFTLPITTTQAILGKFLAAWLFLVLALVLTFPVVVTTVWLGDPDSGVIAGGYIGSALLAGAYLSVGMLTSAMTRNQVISFVLSLVFCLFLVLAGWPPVTDIVAKLGANWLLKGIVALGVIPHFESIQRGVIDLRDIVYYVSVMVVMLFATHVVLKNRRGV